MRPQTNPKNQNETAPPKRVYRIPTCPPGYITEDELARRLGKHVVTMRQARARGDCSAYMRAGKSVFYNEKALAKRFAAAEIDPSKPKKLVRRRKA
jgi:hypothetical protein